jgi:hypothetical protein
MNLFRGCSQPDQPLPHHLGYGDDGRSLPEHTPIIVCHLFEHLGYAGVESVELHDQRDCGTATCVQKDNPCRSVFRQDGVGPVMAKQLQISASQLIKPGLPPGRPHCFTPRAVDDPGWHERPTVNGWVAGKDNDVRRQVIRMRLEKRLAP